MFYDRAGDGPIREVLRSRDDRLRRVILVAPSYPDPFGSGTADAQARSIVTLAPDIRIPTPASTALESSASSTKGTTVAINYLGSRGVGLFRSHDVNAPHRPTTSLARTVRWARSRQIESTGRQTAHSLQFIGRGRLAPHLRGSVQYTFGDGAQRHERHQRTAGEQLRSRE